MENLHVIVSHGENAWNVEIKKYDESQTLLMFNVAYIEDDDLNKLMTRTFKQYSIIHIDTPTMEYQEFKLKNYF